MRLLRTCLFVFAVTVVSRQAAVAEYVAEAACPVYRMVSWTFSGTTPTYYSYYAIWCGDNQPFNWEDTESNLGTGVCSSTPTQPCEYRLRYRATRAPAAPPPSAPTAPPVGPITEAGEERGKGPGKPPKKFPKASKPTSEDPANITVTYDSDLDVRIKNAGTIAAKVFKVHCKEKTIGETTYEEQTFYIAVETDRDHETDPAPDPNKVDGFRIDDHRAFVKHNGNDIVIRTRTDLPE